MKVQLKKEYAKYQFLSLKDEQYDVSKEVGDYYHFKGKTENYHKAYFDIIEPKGYLAPYNLFGGTVKKGMLYIKRSPVFYTPDDKALAVYFMPKEIVENWEAQYDDKEYIEIDGSKLEITKHSNGVKQIEFPSVTFYKNDFISYQKLFIVFGNKVTIKIGKHIINNDFLRETINKF